MDLCIQVSVVLWRVSATLSAEDSEGKPPFTYRLGKDNGLLPSPKPLFSYRWDTAEMGDDYRDRKPRILNILSRKLGSRGCAQRT